MRHRVLITGLTGASSLVGVATAAALRNERRRVHMSRTLRVWRLTTRRGVHWCIVKARGRAYDARRRAELEEQFAIKSAQDVAQVLGGMKGAIMKAGQMFSFVFDGLPEEAQAALSTLQADVAPMAPSLAEQVVREELHADPRDLFLDWDPVPVAAASIGQVHKAVLRDGRVVAVKIQYPGVDMAIGSDLDNAEMLYGMFSSFALPNLDVKSLVDEVRQRMFEEIDYRIEARSQQEFVDAYAGHPFIRIPRVIEEYSSRRVLTSEWVEGERWKDFLASSSPDARACAGEAIMRFAQGSVYYHHFFNGDPHPGNFRFHKDGTVTFLDFGLVKRYTDDEIVQLMPVLDAVLAQDGEALVEQLIRLDCLPPDHGLDSKMILEYTSTPYVPFIEPNFTYTRSWTQEALRKVIDLEGNYADLLRQLNLPATYVILDRLVWGAAALLGRLNVSGSWGALLDEYRHQKPPTTELGEAEARWRRARFPDLTAALP